MVRHKNVIAIMSPKGGVGKTVTVANLASALAMIYDKKVLAVDTNVSTASLGLHFDVFYPKHTLEDAFGKSHEKAIHVYHQNLHLIPASIKIKKYEKSPTKAREELARAVKSYEELLGKVAHEYDFVLLDCSPGFDLETLAAMEIAGGLIIVTNPDYPSVVTAARAVEYARRSRVPVGGIVLNKVGKKKFEIKKEEIEDSLKVKVIEQIPFDKRVPESIAARKPIVLFKTNSKSSEAFKRLAAVMSGREYKKSWLRRLFKF